MSTDVPTELIGDLPRAEDRTVRARSRASASAGVAVRGAPAPDDEQASARRLVAPAWLPHPFKSSGAELTTPVPKRHWRRCGMTLGSHRGLLARDSRSQRILARPRHRIPITSASLTGGSGRLAKHPPKGANSGSREYSSRRCRRPQGTNRALSARFSSSGSRVRGQRREPGDVSSAPARLHLVSGARIR